MKFVFAAALLFVLAHSQAPLYSSNQNQYFLHGLAAGGLGQLHADWLANTADPTPTFSAAVAAAYRHANESIAYVVYGLLLIVYFLSLMSLAEVVPGGPRSYLGRLRLAVGLIAIHAAIARWGAVELFGFDFPWFFQAGVANQYVLGPGLQPSAFGVLLITAIAAFAHDRLVAVGICIATAATMHPTYLLPGALLMLGFLHVLFWEGRRRACALLAIGTLVAVIPILIYGWRTFTPQSAQSLAEAQEILVDIRLPHHARIGQWLDGISIAQIIWVVFGIFVLRGSRLYSVLGLAFNLACALTLIQELTASRWLALLFPWRLSAVLVPIATTVILARAITWFHPQDVSPAAEQRRRYAAVLWSIAIALALAGGALQWTGAFYRMPDDEKSLCAFVRNMGGERVQFVLPITVPNIAAGPRGSPSTTFVSPEQAATHNKFPPDLQRFRLATGVPIFVDFKSIPYRDLDVIEWRRRIAQNLAWQEHLPADEMRKAGVTHVVTPTEKLFDPKRFQSLFESGRYRVLQINSPAAGD